MLRNIFVLLFYFGFTFSYASSEKYTISVCTTSNMENALTCKKRVDESMVADVFIVEDKKRFHTYIGKFDTKQEANGVIKNVSAYVKEQKPYIKLIEIQEEKKPIETEIVKADEPVETKQEAGKEEIKAVETIPLVSMVPNIEDLKPVGSYHFKKDEEIKQEPKKESLEERYGLKDSGKLSKEDERRKEEYKRRLTLVKIDDIYIPKNLYESLTELDRILNFENKKQLIESKDSWQFNSHMGGLGMWIRNNWGINGGSRLLKYFNDRNIGKEMFGNDEISGVIIEQYILWLKGNKNAWKKWEKQNPKK